MTVVKTAIGVALGILIAVGVIAAVLLWPTVVAGPDPTAVLSITTVPAGAAVNVDGRDVGESPQQLRVSIGAHRIVLQRAGYESVSQTVDVPAAGMPYLQPLVALPTPPHAPHADGQH